MARAIHLLRPRGYATPDRKPYVSLSFLEDETELPPAPGLSEFREHKAGGVLVHLAAEGLARISSICPLHDSVVASPFMSFSAPRLRGWPSLRRCSYCCRHCMGRATSVVLALVPACSPGSAAAGSFAPRNPDDAYRGCTTINCRSYDSRRRYRDKRDPSHH